MESARPLSVTNAGEWEMYVDGATFATNPSSLGSLGFTVWYNGKLFFAFHSTLIGEVTGNLAEFAGLYRALLWASQHCIGNLTIYSDSDGLVTWFNGGSNLRNAKVKKLADSINRIRHSVDATLLWVSRDNERQQFTDFISKLGIYNEAGYSTYDAHTALLAYYNNHNGHDLH